MAASLPSPRVMRVSSTMVVRPRCSGMQTARAVSPLGTAAVAQLLSHGELGFGAFRRAVEHVHAEELGKGWNVGEGHWGSSAACDAGP